MAFKTNLNLFKPAAVSTSISEKFTLGSVANVLGSGASLVQRKLPLPANYRSMTANAGTSDVGHAGSKKPASPEAKKVEPYVAKMFSSGETIVKQPDGRYKVEFNNDGSLVVDGQKPGRAGTTADQFFENMKRMQRKGEF